MQWPTVLAVFILAGITYALVSCLRLEKPWLQPWSLVRAILQLGILSLVLHSIVTNRIYVLGFLVLMVLAAAQVVSRRLNWGLTQGLRAAGVMAFSAAIPLSILVATGALSTSANILLAMGGIVVGAVMTISTLFCRTLDARIRAERDQVEGWLAIGATPRRAVLAIVREAGSVALLPSTDQTRATGIVVLPGAFVGAVFAGLPVLEAAVFQILVLGSILCSGAIAVAMWSWMLGAPTRIPTSLEQES